MLHASACLRMQAQRSEAKICSPDLAKACSCAIFDLPEAEFVALTLDRFEL